MDLSKLPKLSETPKPTVEPETQSAAPLIDYGRVPPAEPGAPEAWISFAMGALFLLLNPRLLQYILSPSAFPTKWTFNNPDGSPLAYAQSIYFWSDLAITAFCIALIFDGLVLLKIRNRTVVWIAFLFTMITALGNLAYLLATFNTYGVAITSAIAFAYGVYIALHEWRLLARRG